MGVGGSSAEEPGAALPLERLCHQELEGVRRCWAVSARRGSRGSAPSALRFPAHCGACSALIPWSYTSSLTI